MTHEILVLGAGYAGLAAAGRAARNIRRDRLDARITLVNATPSFVERVRLHQVAVGQDVGVHPLAASLDGTAIELVVGAVEDLDTERRTVRVRTGHGERDLGYDTLVYALGSDAARDGVPGVAEHAHDTASLEAARALERRVREEGPRTVAVVGGGFTGLEVATELAESRPGLRVELVTGGRVADGAGPRGRAHIRRALRRLGVGVREHARVAEVDADGLLLADGSRVGARLVVWNAGFGVAGLAAAAGLTVDGRGRAVVDGFQRSVSHPDVYVVGDAAHAPGVGGRPQRMSCAMGLPMGWTAADAVTAHVAGHVPELPPYGYLFQCVSLGRRDGLVQFVRGDDSPVRFVLTGRLAARYKEFVVASAYSGLNGGQGQPDQYLALARWTARSFARRHGVRRTAVVTGWRGRRERASSVPDPR
ncbi:oxidoreductase [Nocardiopsis terrae]|uniref:NADH dehydrogenase FAD-containing subunit n=1 Tax=Nocardiopsis terrae TaxID=372655 RepID=A0ABR9HHR3_9ACTN|nr:FAD-dependent oxidoreductase [Nocardiopsis terrae]MBE1458568.1 NADH dehydrogenase FAD-containing subunit [Nocardiopsis terrae]GHC79708.1 oxidoreductase [Nocardiopsis terrae]